MLRRLLGDLRDWFRASRRQRLEWRAVRAAETASRLRAIAFNATCRHSGPEAEYLANLARRKAKRYSAKAERLARLAFAEPDDD